MTKGQRVVYAVVWCSEHFMALVLGVALEIVSRMIGGLAELTMYKINRLLLTQPYLDPISDHPILEILRSPEVRDFASALGILLLLAPFPIVASVKLAKYIEKKEYLLSVSQRAVAIASITAAAIIIRLLYPDTDCSGHVCK